MHDGTIVGKGTVAVGDPAEISYIMSLKFEDSPPQEFRILKNIKPGDELPPKDITTDVPELRVFLQMRRLAEIKADGVVKRVSCEWLQEPFLRVRLRAT